MGSRLRRAGAVFIFTFVLSLGLSAVSKTALGYLPLGPSVILLFVIVLFGIIFDVIGVAVTAADEAPFHAMASDRLPGAAQAVWLVRNADQVASFSCDVIGDIAGTLSGAVSASIVFSIISYQPGLNEVYLTTVLVAAVAALTVGGKAFGKGFAIHFAEGIVYRVGMALFLIERVVGVNVFGVGKHKKKTKKAAQHRRLRKE